MFIASIIAPVLAGTQLEVTESFDCIADTYIDSANTNSNYGSADLKVSYDFGLGLDQETFMAFEIVNLPADAEITDVKVDLSVKSMPLDDHSVYLIILQSSEAFDEYTLTWENRPIGVYTQVSGGTITSDSRWEFTCSNYDISGNGIYYFRLYTTTDNLWPITFDSRDDTWNPPKLTVTYTYTSEEITTAITITEPSSPAPSGAVKIEGTLEDKDTLEYSFSLSTDDLLEISLDISTSSIDIEIKMGGKTLQSWSKISNQFNSKVAVAEDGTYKLMIENPGALSGGDELKVVGYYLITSGSAELAQIIVSSSTVTWLIPIIEVICLSIVFIMVKRKKM